MILDPRLDFIDIRGLMLDPDGAPRAELLAQDGLHLSDEGYRLWSEKVKDALEAESAASSARCQGRSRLLDID
jgi:lysophospholipase L1-like esterase